MSGNWMDNKSLRWTGVAVLLAMLSLLPIRYVVHQRDLKVAAAEAAPAADTHAVSCLGEFNPKTG